MTTTRTDKTIEWVVKNGLCTGCGTCAGLCPQSAIHMEINKNEGIYLPVLDKKKCNKCGICYEVCPGHAVDFDYLNQSIFGKVPEDICLGNYENCYVGHANDHTIRYNSSSGGLVTAILLFMLEEGMIDGALVTSTSNDFADVLSSQACLAVNREDIISSCGSRYCPVPVNIRLKEVLSTPGRYAVVGLPCQIHGIRKAELIEEKLKEKIVLHIGLFCIGTNINLLGTQFVLQKMNIGLPHDKDHIKRIDYRIGQFPPGTMSVELKDGTTKQISHIEFWSMLFSWPFSFAPIRCMYCIDATNELSDLSIGSWWLPELRDGVLGESVCVAKTKFAAKLIENAKLKKRIEIVKISREKLIEFKEKQIISKKLNLRIRTCAYSLFKKKAPNYNTNIMLNSKISFFIFWRSLESYLCLMVSLKKFLWPLMTVLSIARLKTIMQIRKIREYWRALL